MDKLKPCPFCGSTDVEYHFWNCIPDVQDIARVDCNNCFATLIQTHVKKRLDEEIENDPRNSPQSDEDVLTEF